MFAMHCKPVRGSAREYVAATGAKPVFGSRYFYKDAALTELVGDAKFLSGCSPTNLTYLTSNVRLSPSPYPLATHIIRPYVSAQNWVQFILLFFASVG